MVDREQQGTQATESQGRSTGSRASSTAGRTHSRRPEGNRGTRSEGGARTESGTTTPREQERRGEQGGVAGEREGEDEGRRPRYGIFYATAIRRISQRPRYGFGTSYGRQSEEPGYGYGGTRGGLSRGFTEQSFGRGGGYGGQGSYGSQYIRGMGGQSGERLGHGGGGAELGGTDLEQGRSYGRTGIEGREQERERGGDEWQENRERYARQGGEGRLQDRDFGVGSRFEEGRRGGRSQATRGEQEASGWTGGQAGLEKERRGRRTRWQREPVTAREVMTRDVKAVTKQSTLKNVAQIMKDENCGIVPIVDDGHKLLGVVTDRDLVIRTLAGDKSPLECKVEDVMTDDVHAVTPDEELRDVIDLMGHEQVRRVPVVDRDDRLVGIIAMADVANRADYDEGLQEALEDISSKRSFWSRLWR